MRTHIYGLAVLGVGLLLGTLAAGQPLNVHASDRPDFIRKETWQETMRASLEARRASQQAEQEKPPRLFSSEVLRGSNPAQALKASLPGWKELYLIVDEMGDYHHDMANWGEAKLITGDNREIFLDTLEPASVEQGWGTFHRNQDAAGGALQIGPRKFTRGLGTHARSVIRYALKEEYVSFEAWVGLDDSRGTNGCVRFIVSDHAVGAKDNIVSELWAWVGREFGSAKARREMSRERADRIWEKPWENLGELAQRYATAARAGLMQEARELAAKAEDVESLDAVRKIYHLSQALDEAQIELERFNFTALRLAIHDLSRTFGERYPNGAAYLRRLDDLEKLLGVARQPQNQAAGQTTGRLGMVPSVNTPEAVVQLIDQVEQLRALSREALLANPALDFEKVLLVRRKANHLGLPANWQGNASLPRAGFENSIATLDLRRARDPVTPREDSPEEPRLTTLYKPSGSPFVGDVELHFDADRLLFSSIGTHNRWQVFEVGVDGTGLRQVTLGDQPDVDNYDACYLPDGAILFTSTAGLAGVPCVDGSDHVATLFRLEADGRSIRQLGFDQDHNWSPTLLADGRVLYQRWEYADTPHSQTRLLFQMNPDGTGQAEFYGSNSYWPNAMFYARPIPGHPTKVAAIISGHHGVPRMGELVILDPARGRHEASGVVQRIPGYGKKVEPIIRDQLVDESWPKFLHPFPLNEHYFLVSAKPRPDALWGIYLVDIFDNMVLLAETPGEALLEPVPLRETSRPPIIPSRVDPQRKDALVLLSDIYQGKGLEGVPRGAVKALRVYAYNWSFRGMGGLLGTVGLDGPWDVRRILGTVPVEADGSAYFRVPANTPISVQPLDAEGKALQLMRSWFTAMPGEHLSCVGCHEKQNNAPSGLRADAFVNRAPAEIQPWHGPARGFSYAREVQPAIDKFCVGCHNGEPGAEGRSIPDLRGTEKVTDFRLITPGHAGKHGGKFSVGYAELHRYVRRPGIESDYHMLTPLEYHADTTELVQMLRKGHHGVQLDGEAWDRLVTWIDLNAPYHGTWSEEIGNPGQQCVRRQELRRLYAGMDDPDPEFVRPIEAKPIEFIKPAPVLPPALTKVDAKGWPFDAQEAARRQATAGLPERRVVELGGGVRLELILAPSGEFVMGDPAGQSDERPASQVQIRRAFWMAKAEISNQQFAAFDSTHDSRVESKTAYQFGIHGFPLNESDQPVVRVTWSQAMAFCQWLSLKTGEHFTLPTEAQWEYACRAGSSTAFSFGEADADFSKFANLADAKLTEFSSDPYTVFKTQENPSQYEDYIPKEKRFNDGGLVSRRVGSYLPNAWGLQDMHGNVAEWTRSNYRPYPCDERDGRNDISLLEKKIVRGGSWRDRPARAHSAFRLAYQPWQAVFNVGFRVVCEPGETSKKKPGEMVSVEPSTLVP